MQNEIYITDDCIIENEAYQIFKDKIKCDLCHNILKDPIICKKCQNNYCKICIDKWKKKNKKNALIIVKRPIMTKVLINLEF